MSGEQIDVDLDDTGVRSGESAPERTPPAGRADWSIDDWFGEIEAIHTGGAVQS